MYIVIEKVRYGYVIKHDNPKTGKTEKMRYLDYSERNAIKQHRINFGLTGKHLTKIHI